MITPFVVLSASKIKEAYLIGNHISISGPPSAPSDCDVHNHTSTELGVTCATPGFDGGDASGHTFHLEVRI